MMGYAHGSQVVSMHPRHSDANVMLVSSMPWCIDSPCNNANITKSNAVWSDGIPWQSYLFVKNP